MAIDRTARAAVHAAVGGALAGVALLLSAEFVWTLLLLLDLVPPPRDQTRAVPIAAALGAAVALGVGRRWSRSVSAEAAAVVVRHALFFILVLYSTSKLLGAQFRLPYAALDTPLGDASGYALTWRFFGYSSGYGAFVAAGQLVGAALLLHWRTTTLGACVLIGVLSNIAVVNFTHDLPVKLASTCYLLMACYLIVPDLPRLAALFVANEPLGARPPPAIAWPRSPWRRLALKTAFVVLSVAHAIAYVQLGDSRPTPISGAWAVEPGSELGQRDWRVVYFEREFGDTRRGSVRLGEDRGLLRFRYELEPDGCKLRLMFAEPDRANDFVGTYELAPDGRCVLRGACGPDAVTVRLVRKRV